MSFPTDYPLPGETFEGRTVIASGWYRDDIIAVMSLEAEAPYFRVDSIPLREVDDDGDRLTRFTDRFHNIVPAAQFFDEEFGLWGG